MDLLKRIALKICTGILPSRSTVMRVWGRRAYEFLEGGVYWCDSQSVNKKVPFHLSVKTNISIEARAHNPEK